MMDPVSPGMSIRIFGTRTDKANDANALPVIRCIATRTDCLDERVSVDPLVSVSGVFGRH